MLSGFLETLGFAALTLAAYEYSGRALALLVIATACFTMGLAADGVKPIVWLRARLSLRWQAFQAKRAQRMRGITSPNG